MRQLKITKQITNRESESLDRYLQEIARVDLLTADEETDLAQRIRKGDRVALDKLTRANLRFVVSVAKQYQNQGLTLNDLINEGNVGLIKAARRFDETRGFKFISYAVWWIRQSILQALAEQSRIVRVPSNRIGSFSKIVKVTSVLEQTYEREPSPEEIGELMNLSANDVTELMSISGRHVSLDAPFAIGEDQSMYDVMSSTGASISPDDEVMNQSMKIDLDYFMSFLSKREHEVLSMYFGFGSTQGITLEEIGNRLDLTRERVRQIKDKAIRRLRANGKSSYMRTYLN